MKLRNKTIVISGATKGIGKQLAIELINQGANVVLGGRDSASVKNVLEDANKSTQRAVFVHTDLEKVEDCKKLFDTAIEAFKKIDGFVNYAGITPVASLVDCSEETFDSVMGINTKAAYFCAQSVIKYMRESGGGSIVFVGSAHSWSGQKDRSAYAVSKGALFTLSEHIAHNYAEENIRSNYVTMGWTPTEGEIALRKQEGKSEKDLHTIASSAIPMGRMLTPEDHIAAFLYLLSDNSSMVTGSNIRITGGEYI
jgi:NAD(P)-dependent dehydrogenase (short-subunit alcohol dehydrogenase family)